MPYKIASISIFIFLLSLPISGRIINWATDADLNYAIGDIIIFNSANYVASAIGSQSPSENPSNFVNIEEELTQVSQTFRPIHLVGRQKNWQPCKDKQRNLPPLTVIPLNPMG